MWQVNIGEKILYYPANDSYAIYDTKLNEEVGSAGEFSFKVPPQNPLYADLTTGALITILKNGVEYWRGEIKEITVDFAKVADVYCLEDLSFLDDEFLLPAQITNETFAQRFQSAIAAYNLNRSSDRQFTAGYITNVTSTNLCNWTTEYDMSILDDLRECIAGEDGYLRVRRSTVGGVCTRYIDIVRLADYGVPATQTIEYGYNLLDYVKESDYENLTNVLTPYGAELESEVYEGYSARLAGTPIQNNDSITAFGRHAKAVVFDTDDLTTLNNLASAYLSRYSQPQLTMEVDAVDLSAIENVSEINIGDSVHIISRPFAVDQWIYLTKIERDLQNIDRNKITLSGHVQTGRTLTSQSQRTAQAIKNLPSKSSILDAAKKNALALLNGVEGGYVKFQTDENDNIIELTIQNAELDENVTKRWRWNLGGLGYQERPSAADDWDLFPPSAAMTMDGSIVANFITTGELNANNGVFELNMSTGQVTMKNGDFKGKITSTSGQIGGFTINATSLTVTPGSAILSANHIGCGNAGLGMVNLVGNRSAYPDRYGFIQISNSGNLLNGADTCLDGIRIFGDGSIRHYDANGYNDWSKSLNAIP